MNTDKKKKMIKQILNNQKNICVYPCSFVVKFSYSFSRPFVFIRGQIKTLPPINL